MIEEAQALGFYFDWDEEKDREKQKKKYLLDPQQYFENCAKAQAYYKANGHHFIPDDQPEAEWWKQSNDGSGMGKIPLLPPMNQGPNSNLTNEGFTCTQNDGSGMDELRPVPPLPKKLPELKKDVSGGFPLCTCDCCHNANIPTNHYCMQNVSQGPLFVFRGPDGREPEKQICGQAICLECKALAGIQNSICPTCFLPIKSQEELEGMGIGDLRDLGKRVRLGLPNIDKCRKATVIPALCETCDIFSWR